MYVRQKYAIIKQITSGGAFRDRTYLGTFDKTLLVLESLVAKNKPVTI